MPDPFLTSARDLLRRARDDTRAAIEGLPPDALNWRPAGDDTNSIAVLVTHSLTSTRWWLSVAVDEPPPERDRDSEFEASARDAGELLALVDGLFEECLSLVDKSRSVDWSALRSQGDPGRDTPLFAAWALLHALEHLREHVGQMSLTRQMWEQRPA
ncbi:MAG: DinB family protein [Dehalococcoidia bacterium]|nr:DinB family protein [Dehalococcoidia bacterium]